MVVAAEAIGDGLVWMAVTTLMTAYVLWNVLGVGRRLKIRNQNFPPGPIGLPIIGSMLNVNQDSHKYFRDLSVEYRSAIVSVTLGTREMVVMNDFKSIHEALVKQSDVFSGRPYLFLWDKTLKKEDLVTTHGRLWRERKRVILHQLRNMGVGKLSMEEVIMNEVKKTIDNLESNLTGHNGRINFTHLFFPPIFNIMAKIMVGNTYEVNDKALADLSKVMKFNFECFKNDSPLNFMPYLRHVPGLTNFKEFMKSHFNVVDLLRASVDEHERTYVDGEPRDLIDIYLKEIAKGKDETKSEQLFTKEYLLGLMYNLSNAGVETTEHTLGFSCVYMAVWPEIQSKVQAEIDKVLGGGRFPTYSDRKLMPYTEAVIMEILRFSTTLPLSLPHAPTADANVNGYTIPKGTFVLPNIYAVHFDKELWGDPEIFRPERFLDDDGNVHEPEYFIPFSLGARFCLGEALAKMEVFLFFTSLMQTYTFHCITGEPPPTLDSIVGVTQRPHPYSLIVKHRSALID